MGLPKFYIRRSDGAIERCDNIEEQSRWYRDIRNRRIARHAIPYNDNKEAVLVETLFLSWDYRWASEDDGEAPLLFEVSAKMPGEHPDFLIRTASEEEALAAHEKVCKEVFSLLHQKN